MRPVGDENILLTLSTKCVNASVFVFVCVVFRFLGEHICERMIERVRRIVKSGRGRDKTNNVLNCFTERYYFYLMNGQTFYSHCVKKTKKKTPCLLLSILMQMHI